MGTIASILVLAFALAGDGPTPSSDADAACVRDHAALVAAEYEASLEATRAMRAEIRAFCEAPSEDRLARARASWIAARMIYGRTECFRFGNGPIDTRRGGIETFVNAWPVDEAYIDLVPGAAAAGIISDPKRYPSLGRAVLRLHNQRGGETNVCTGWHAIEFLLWGQDRSADGPGDRPVRDFLDGEVPFADRRREFLLEVTDLLVEDLAKLAAAWRPGEENYRARFESDPSGSMRSILAGVALLSGFEMAGERLAVALETRDQEQEHSCFSDTTHLDFRANIEGIALVLRGRGGTGTIAAVRARDPARADALEAALADAIGTVGRMPVPFDRAIAAPDGSEERSRLEAAIAPLERLSETVSETAKAVYGFHLPTEPQG